MTLSAFLALERQTRNFWRKVNKTESCWLWTAATYEKGHGAFWFDGRMWVAHRVSWHLHGMTVPDGMFLLHDCDNPPCVNPDHLYIGTKRDNLMDSYEHGWRSKVENRVHMYGAKNPKTKLTADQVREIRNLSPSTSYRELARRFGVCPSTITAAVTGRTWGHL